MREAPLDDRDDGFDRRRDEEVRERGRQSADDDGEGAHRDGDGESRHEPRATSVATTRRTSGRETSATSASAAVKPGRSSMLSSAIGVTQSSGSGARTTPGVVDRVKSLTPPRGLGVRGSASASTSALGRAIHAETGKGGLEDGRVGSGERLLDEPRHRAGRAHQSRGRLRRRRQRIRRGFNRLRPLPPPSDLPHPTPGSSRRDARESRGGARRARWRRARGPASSAPTRTTT